MAVRHCRLSLKRFTLIPYSVVLQYVQREGKPVWLKFRDSGPADEAFAYCTKKLVASHIIHTEYRDYRVLDLLGTEAPLTKK